MSRQFDELRGAADREIASEEVVPSDQEPAIDQVLEAFFSAEPPSELWLEILDVLAEGLPIPSTPALPSTLPRRVFDGRAVSVEEALRVPTAEARRHLSTALRITADAAAELLDRPASALARRDPAAVRTLAGLAGRAPGQLLGDIAASWRADKGFVYAYRPGMVAEAPAERKESADIAQLVDWGLALLS